jgi:hypothetical protein
LPRHPARKFSLATSRRRASQHLSWIGAALGALALASPLAIAAVPATAQVGIVFGQVSRDGSGDLAITIESDNPLVTITIHLWSGGSGTGRDVLDTSDFTPPATFQPGVFQTYVLANPAHDLETGVPTPLPPGSYTATGDATDNQTNNVTGQSLTGTFNFLAQPTLALSSPTFNTTAPSQAVTITGQITGCSTVACPSNWSGTSVIVTDVTAAAKPQWTGAATDATGDFSVSGVSGIPGDKYSASLPATSTSLAATAPSTTQDVPQYAQTLIMATAAAAPYGQQTIKGTLTYQSGLQQLAAPAGVTISATAGSHTLTTTTSNSGAFSLAVPPITGTTTWLLSTENNLSSSPFLAGTQSSVGASQLWLTAITKFTAKVTPDPEGGALLYVSGCMVSTTSPPPSGQDDPEVEIEWRGSSTANWQVLGFLGTSRVPGCAGLTFVGSGTPKVLSAYYRAVVIADTTYAGSTSVSTGRVWIDQTRFYPFTATPHSVAYGKKITVSGTLQYHGSKWRSLAGQRVAIIFSHNKKTWFFYGNVRTNGKGALSVTFPDVYGSGWWSANYGGNKTDVSVSAGTARVKVHGHASAKPTAPVSPPPGLRPVSKFSDPNWGAARSGLTWRYLLSADPLLVLMGD